MGMFVFRKNFQLCGTDKFGNSYHIINGKREVHYLAEEDATKISTEWFLWLHYAIAKLPNHNTLSRKEYRIRIPNLTGTAGAYTPVQSSLDHKTCSYKPWNPNGD